MASSFRTRGFALVALALAGCSKLTEPPKPEPVIAEPAEKAAAKPTAQPEAQPQPQPQQAPPAPAPVPDSGKVEIKELAAGKGPEAKPGDTVSVHYVGTLTDGKEFDQSKKRGKPFDFQLGAGQVIKGWDEGVKGMKPGSKRKLTIPPSLGYGARGVPPTIPPNATLVFEVELLEIKKK